MPSPDAAFDAAAAALAGERGSSNGQRLDFISRALILRLRAIHPHKPVAEIARELGHHPVTVGKVLGAQEVDAKAFTQALMATDNELALEQWAAARGEAALKGDHRPARDWLVAAGAIEAQAGTAINVGFQVVVAPRPGLPDFTVNELPPSVVTRVSAPTSHVQPQAPSAMPDERTIETNAERTNVPTPTEVHVPTQAALLTTPVAQRHPSTPTHPRTRLRRRTP